MKFYNILVDSDIYDDSKTASVSCYGNSLLLGASTDLYVVIKEVGPALSKLIYSTKAYKSAAKKIKSACETKSRDLQ